MPLNQVSEEDCWFVIGAHQAGASERQCAELSGLSKTIIHNILANFKKMGSPHASNLSVSTLLENGSNTKKRKMSNTSEKNMPRKRGRPRKPAEPPFFTEFIVRDVLYEARKDQIPLCERTSSSVYPLNRLDTPPNDDDNENSLSANNNKRRNSNSIEDANLTLPLTPRSFIALEEEDKNEDDKKREKREEDVWTMENDKELLKHVLELPMKYVKWKELESKFGGRHLARMCSERWEYIKKQILKDIDQVTVDASKENEGNTKLATTLAKHHTSNKHRKHHTSSSVSTRTTKTIRNCSLASIQRKRLLNKKKSFSSLPPTQTIFVCVRHSTKTKTKKPTTKKVSHKKHGSNEKKHSHSSKNSTTTKKKKQIKSKKTTKTKKKTSTRKTKKASVEKVSVTNIHLDNKSGATTTTPIAAVTATTITEDTILSYNDPSTANSGIDEGSENIDDDTASDESSENSEEFILSSTTLSAPTEPLIPAPLSPTTPIDNNNQVAVQSVQNGQEIESEPQSKVVGVSVGAVVGCLAAAGLAGMFIYKRKQKTNEEQQVSQDTEEVNTRWRTQSFMAVVAGAVAKLPHRSNSSTSSRSGGVLGSIRRAASNASRSLSIRSNNSSSSSIQSYGIAVSGPIPAIVRIDGDQAQYYDEPSSPSGQHAQGYHTHAY
ncbi:MAG: hypothetical protein EXX96DRAFT_654629 [Benjaminiella poitrasii]|nr:MAG: hypothetical protein EXX96DRAFT_654629 [Benjaminiella poitrasii]